ncbi:MAG: hypothetical protein GY832_21380, partial [Chloroflexi bacterium]|nr:hypothetical protein [Chloroflexota bacterium]
PDAALGVNLHHDKGNRTRVRESLIETTSAAPEVSELVKLVDRIVSASSAIQASELLRANTFSRHYLTVTYHQVRIRGVSTMLLHEACRRAHVEHGWTPLLYYPDAVLYVARREFGSNISPITPEQIREQLQRVLADFAETQSQRSGFPNLFLNNITTTFLIFSDMFDCTLTRSLLEAASYKLGYKKGIPQGQEALQDAVDTCIQKLDAQITRHKLPVKLDGPPLATARLVWSSGREIAVSKAFKLLMYGTSKAPALVDSVGARVAQEMYDGLFGTDTFERLRRTANLKREVDYMWGIYPFHQQTVAKLIQFLSVVPDTLRGLDPHVRVSALAPRKRVRLLVEILSTIAERAFDAMESPQTCGTQMARAAQVLLRDLVMPDAGHDNSWADIESVFTPGGSNRRIFACAL